VNSLAIKRKAKQAIGAIARLVQQDGSGREMTINVEYNQLDPLLRSTVSPEGDVNDASGYSPYPGNINQVDVVVFGVVFGVVLVCFFVLHISTNLSINISDPPHIFTCLHLSASLFISNTKQLLFAMGPCL
jgi:hypothetical protein